MNFEDRIRALAEKAIARHEEIYDLDQIQFAGHEEITIEPHIKLTTANNVSADPETMRLVADVLEAVTRFNEAEWSEDCDSREKRLMRSACIVEMRNRKAALDAHTKEKT